MVRNWYFMPEMSKSIERPLIVTILSWFFILWALFSVLPKIFLLIDPETYKIALDFNQSLSKQSILHIPLWIQLAHSIAGVPVLVVAGIFMLRGSFGALVTLIFWITGVVAITFMVSGLSIALYAKLIGSSVLAILLTSRKSMVFFNSRI